MLSLGVHAQLELRILRGFVSEKFQKTRLRHHEDVREARLQAAKIERTERAVGELQGGAGNLGVRNFVKFIGETNLVEYFHGGRMNGVAAKFAVEVLVHFEQGDVN